MRLKHDIFICLPRRQMQMFKVWLQLHGGPGGTQISPVTEGGPGWLHIWSNSVWNVFEPILWHRCKWFTEVSTANCVLRILQLLKCAMSRIFFFVLISMLHSTAVYHLYDDGGFPLRADKINY